MVLSQPYQALVKQYRLVLTALRTPKFREQLVGVLNGSSDCVHGPWAAVPWIAAGAVDDSVIAEDLELLKTLLGQSSVVLAEPVTELPADPAERRQLLEAICRRVFSSLPQGRDWLTEQELNARLAMLVDDVATVRRYCVDLGLLCRSGDASRYRLGTVHSWQKYL